MKKYLTVCCGLLLAGCGGGGSTDTPTPTPTPTPQSSTFSFAISDAPVDSALKVMVTISAIDLIKLDNDDEGSTNVTTLTLDPAVQVDLLEYQGAASLTLLNDVDVEAGDYEQVRLNISEDIAETYFENGDGVFQLRVPSGKLKLGSVTIGEGANDYTAEFNLRRAVVYNPGPNRYQLKPNGVRLVRDETIGSINGRVDENLFVAGSCVEKVESLEGNIVYLYAGVSLDPAALEDEFDQATATDEQILPIASAALELQEDATYTYEFGQVEVGDYTVAFSCDATNDDPEVDDDITIPSPADKLAEVSVTAGQASTVDFTE